MVPEDNTVFDVSKPKKLSASPNSRPMIVGHHPTMPDPMFRNLSLSPDKSDYVPPNTIVHPDDSSSSAPPANIPTDSESPSSVAILEGEPMQSPPYQKHPSPIPISALTTVASTIPVSSSVDSNTTTSRSTAGRERTITRKHDLANIAPGQSHGRFRLWWLAIVLAVVASIYLALDSGLLPSNINLPLHVFGQDKQTTTSTSSAANGSGPTLPAGFSKYNLAGTGLSFASPTSWGAPTAAPDPGFSKRGGANVSDGKYAYVVNFPSNKEVEMAFTSYKYLPPTRATQYYDFLQWCIGTNDGNYYQSVLRYNSVGGIDTPATVTCDQGPMSGVTELDGGTIVQSGLKAADGKVLGDLYTKNLNDNNLVVVRVRDTSAKNAESIKKLLGTIQSYSIGP